jgi:hypothetical protein
MQFGLDELTEAARRRSGLSDPDEGGSLEGLEVLLRSVERDTRLTFTGRLSLRQLINSILVNRLMLTAAQRTTPELRDEALIPPLIITGLPRSGTTLLHRMLATDPDHHAPPLWEAMYPLPPAGRFDGRRLRCRLGLIARKALLGGLDAKHHVAVDAAEEDLFVLGGTFETWLFWGAAPVHGYIDWYLSQDRTSKYRNYRAWLQVIQAAHPGRRLVLKAPEHIGGTSALLSAIPEARVIHLHRDPVTAFSSYVSLVRTTQKLSVKESDPVADSRTTLRLLSTEITRNLADRERHSDSIVDVRYDDLVADPRAVARLIYRECGLQQTEAAAAAIERHIDDNPQGKHGHHRHTISDTAISETEVRTQFGRYSERFGFAV